MKLYLKGNNKDIYDLENGLYLIKFKDYLKRADDAGTGGENPPNEGLWYDSLRLTAFFFALLKDEGIPTHFVSADLDKAELLVLPADKFGEGFGVVCQYRAVGCFLRRYGIFATEGQMLDALVEVSLKDDDHRNPPIKQEMLEELGVLNPGEYDRIIDLTYKVTGVIKKTLDAMEMDLYDIELEFGRDERGIVVIDEISGRNMHVYKDGAMIPPRDLAPLILDPPSEEDEAVEGENQ